MSFLLDTNPCIAVMRGRKPLVMSRFQSHPTADLFVCSLVVGELYTGAARSTSPTTERAKVAAFLPPM